MTRSMYKAMLYGKGYSPDHKTDDKDLKCPSGKRGDELFCHWLDEQAVEDDRREDELVDILAEPEEKEPDRRPRGMPRAWGRKWDDDKLTPPPEGWSPKTPLRRS